MEPGLRTSKDSMGDAAISKKVLKSVEAADQEMNRELANLARESVGKPCKLSKLVDKSRADKNLNDTENNCENEGAGGSPKKSV